MKIEDLRETAALAHLNLTDEELARAFPAFEQMLGFFASMQAADNDTEAFSASIGGLSRDTNVVSSGFFRQDTQIQAFTPEKNETLLENAGERDGRFILVPNVL